MRRWAARVLLALIVAGAVAYLGLEQATVTDPIFGTRHPAILALLVWGVLIVAAIVAAGVALIAAVSWCVRTGWGE